jgi:hypothetical protein
MTCFQWQSRVSDYLDGTLSDPLQKDAEEHQKKCKVCGERLDHYRAILKTLAGQPRIPLPPVLKKSAKKSRLPKLEILWMNLGRWEKLPWYIRTVIEGFGIVLVVLVGISSAPKIRALYEKSVEHSLSDYKDNINLGHSTPEGESVPPLEVAANATQEGRASDDEIAGEADSAPSANGHFGHSQLWRFTLKTVSPDELRPLVVKALTELKIPPTTPGLGGIQVPGGIEFDLIVPETVVSELKGILHKLVAKPGEIQSETEPEKSENFSWYRVHSKQKLPDGKSKVVIWLSQPNG